MNSSWLHFGLEITKTLAQQINTWEVNASEYSITAAAGWIDIQRKRSYSLSSSLISDLYLTHGKTWTVKKWLIVKIIKK